MLYMQHTNINNVSSKQIYNHHDYQFELASKQEKQQQNQRKLAYELWKKKRERN